ncbi:hypothetical protein GCM10010221_30350 [Streptomyces parvus]|nr:hypothetical protein GCM10010221_30350 [Streptomyces parvus]
MFAERGIDAARIDEITERAGVAIGTFYLHFSSKRDIMSAVQARFVDRLVERQHAAAQNLPADDWIGRVDAWLSDAVRIYVEHAQLHDVLYGHTPINATTEIQVSPENAHVEAFRRLIAERPDPPADAPNPAMAALLIYSAASRPRTCGPSRTPSPSTTRCGRSGAPWATARRWSWWTGRPDATRAPWPG